MDRKSRTKKKRALKIIIVLALFFIFVAAVFYGLIFTPLFRIDKVFVEGAEIGFNEEIKKIANQKLAKIIFEKIPVNNQIFLPDKAIANEILNKFPEIKVVNIKTRLSDHSLTINFQLRQPSAIWCRVLVPDNLVEVSSSTDEAIISSAPSTLPEAENCFFIDNDRFVFKPAPILSGGIVPIVYEQMTRDLNIKDVVSNSKALQFILETKKQLDAANLNLTDFIISGQTLGDLEILSPDGWKIILNLDVSPAVQINALKRVLEEEIKEKRGQLEYVDLRVENRVYYKLK